MTLHSAKGLEFEPSSCPAGRRACSRTSARSTKAAARGLEEERRLAYVGLTRAKKNLPHLVRLQPAHPRPVAVDNPVALPRGTAGGPCRRGGSRHVLRRLWLALRPHLRRLSAGRQNPYGASRFDNIGGASGASDKGRFRRAQLFQHLFDAGLAARAAEPHRGDTATGVRAPAKGRAHRLWRDRFRLGAGRGSVKGRTIDGELVAKSVSRNPSTFKVGDRVFHIKFGNGNVASIEGNKLTIDFDKAGQKKVLEGFVVAV